MHVFQKKRNLCIIKVNGKPVDEGGLLVKITVIDGQGGGIGKAIVEQIKANIPNVEVIAVGTNVFATSAMLKAGADNGATGENAIIWMTAQADIIRCV